MEWPDPRSERYWNDLVQEVKSPGAIPLVPFVGAGLSAPCGYKLWGAFLRAIAAECGLTSQIEARIRQGEFEEAADDLEDGLGRQNFADSVRHEYGCEREIHGAVRLIPKLACGPVITTNFDRVLERTFAEDAFDDVVWGSQVDRIADAVRGNRRYLLKLHGDAHERTDRILTRREYEKHYGSADPYALPAQLRQIYASRILLFVGCSLGADRTLRVLENLAAEAHGMHHYAIVERPATDGEFFARQKRLGNCNIRALWYRHGEHDQVARILEELANTVPADPRAPKLTLVPALRQFEGTTPEKELDLLIPHHRTTELAGRDEDLARMRGWLNGPRPTSVRVLTGQGGAGKTRLAIELILESEKQGWHAGWLTEQELEGFRGRQNLTTWTWPRHTLAVVDYAGTMGPELKRWVDALVANKARVGGPRLRLLLLEREANTESGWLASLLAEGFTNAGVRAMFDPAAPVPLLPIREAVDRRSILTRTLARAAEVLKVEPPQVPPAGADALFDSRLASDTWRDPLTLMMVAIAALPDGLVEALSLSRTDLAFRLADRERERLRRYDSTEVGGKLLARMVGVVTACGGLDRARLLEAAKSECAALGFGSTDRPAEAVERVCAAWPGKAGAAAILPDIVAEAFLLRVLDTEAVVRAAAVDRWGVARSVMRVAQDFGARGHEAPFEWLDGLVRKAEAEDFSLLLALHNALPQQTVALRMRAVEISRLISERLAQLADASGDDVPTRMASQVAHMQNNLCVRLGEVGRREEAIIAGEKAVRIYRQLARANRDAFLPGLAMSVSNLATGLRELGRRAEALEAAEEAVLHYRQLAQAKPDVFLTYLAMSVNNVALMLREVGRRAEALEAAEEAVLHYRQLARANPDAFLPYLATSVNNVAMMLSEVGRRAEALEPAEEAVRLRRQLVRANPDAFLPDLATSVSNLAAALSEVGRNAEALQAAEEAVRFRRQLAQSSPDAFLPDLAMSVNNMAALLSAVGKRAEALEAAAEAVRLYRQLAQSSPDAFLSDLAMSVNNMALRLSEVGRRTEALEAAEEAVRLRQQLARTNPDAFLPDVAASLGVLGFCHLAAERPTAAVPCFAEGIRTLAPYLKNNPQRFGPLASYTAQLYLHATEAAGQEPDPELLFLLEPILKTQPRTE